MCLTIKNRRGKPENSIKIAESDITVYKYFRHGVVNVLITPFRKKVVNQPFMEARDFGFRFYDQWEVHEGIHAYRIDYPSYRPPGSRKHECYIPAGTEYILGKNGDIVTKFLIIGEKI